MAARTVAGSHGGQAMHAAASLDKYVNLYLRGGGETATPTSPSASVAEHRHDDLNRSPELTPTRFGVRVSHSFPANA